MGMARAVHTIAIEEFLSDDEWHDGSEIVRACGLKVHPSQAARRARQAGRTTMSDAQAVMTGTRMMILDTLRLGRRRGKYERNGDLWRRNPDHPAFRPRATAKLTLAQAEYIREQAAQGKTMRGLAEEFGVAQSAIWRIVSQRTYKTSKSA